MPHEPPAGARSDLASRPHLTNGLFQFLNRDLDLATTFGQALYEARQYDQAIEELRRTLEMDPSFVQAHLYLGMVYEQKGRFAAPSWSFGRH
jgi:tetratricopeptide (TPR) repeat protein